MWEWRNAFTRNKNAVFKDQQAESQRRFQEVSDWISIRGLEIIGMIASIKIHLITLYQSGQVTKELIQEKDLAKFYIGFRYCIKEDDQYIPVSGMTPSNVIEQSKNFSLLDSQPSAIHCFLVL